MVDIIICWIIGFFLDLVLARKLYEHNIPVFLGVLLGFFLIAILLPYVIDNQWGQRVKLWILVIVLSVLSTQLFFVNYFTHYIAPNVH